MDSDSESRVGRSHPEARKTLTDACRVNDLKQSEVNKWIEQLLDGGKRNLKVNSKSSLWGEHEDTEY